MARVPGGFGVKRPDRSVSLGFAGDVAADPLSYLGSAGASGRRGPALGRPAVAGVTHARNQGRPAPSFWDEVTDLEEWKSLLPGGSEWDANNAGVMEGLRGIGGALSEAIGGGLKAADRGLGAVDRTGERIGETMQDWERSLGDALFSALGGVGDVVGSVKGVTKDALMGIIRDFSDRRNEQHRGERKHTYGSDAWHGF